MIYATYSQRVRKKKKNYVFKSGPQWLTSCQIPKRQLRGEDGQWECKGGGRLTSSLGASPPGAPATSPAGGWCTEEKLQTNQLGGRPGAHLTWHTAPVVALSCFGVAWHPESPLAFGVTFQLLE